MGRLLKNDDISSGNGEGLVMPVGPTADRAKSPSIGTFRFNTDTNVIEVFNGTEFKSLTKQGSVAITTDTFTGDGSSTAYTMTIEPTAAQNIIVFVGNVFQIAGTNYTVAGTTITFTSPPPDTHTVVVLHGFDSTVVN